jgi:hypothetical protein
VASVTNNAPASFPLGTTKVTWTVTDASGNTRTIEQVVIVSPPLNQKPVVNIISPVNNAVYAAGATIPLAATATDADGSVTKVEFYDKGVKFLVDSTSPYGLSAQMVEAGQYVLTAKAFDNLGDSTVSDTIRVTVTGCTPAGSITAEGYANIEGSAVWNLTGHPSFPNSPAIVTTLPSLEYGVEIADRYGVRLRGYICAPETGNYTFYIASDDQSELYLSTNDNPANKVRIAYLNSEVGFRAYNTYFTQKSAPIYLVKGVRYYIETLHKEFVGPDHLSVAWTLPSGVTEAPIQGNRLSPLSGGAGVGGTRVLEKGLRTLTDLKFNVNVISNPSTTRFTLVVSGAVNQPVTIRIMDAAGREVEARRTMGSTGSIAVGDNLKAGIYFAEVTQGTERKVVKLVKY